MGISPTCLPFLIFSLFVFLFSFLIIPKRLHALEHFLNLIFRQLDEGWSAMRAAKRIPAFGEVVQQGGDLLRFQRIMGFDSRFAGHRNQLVDDNAIG